MGLSQAGFFLAPCFIFCLFHTYKRSSLNSYKYVTVIVSLIVLIGVGSLNSFTNGVASGMGLFITSPLIIAFSVTTLVIVITQGAIDRRTGQFWVSWIVIALAFVPFTKNLIDSVKNIPSKTDFITSDARLKELVGNNIIISDSPNDTAWYADIHSVLAPTNILMVNNIRQKALNEGLEIKGLHFTEKSIFNLNTFGQTVRYNTYFILVAYPVISTYMPDLMPDYSNIHTSTGFSQPINLVTNYRIYYPFSNE